MEEIEKQLEPYLNAYLDDDNDVIIAFDKPTAEKDNIPVEVMEYGEDLESMSYAFKQGTVKTRVTLPVWGNYCGPG